MKTRYLYYKKKTGQITDILATRKRGRAPYLVCDFEEVRGFIDGSKGINQYIVAYNNEMKKNVLLEKNNIISFRKPSKKLYKIPYKKNAETDIQLIYYTDNVLEVCLDISRIAPLYQTNFKKDVRFEKGTEIRLILKEADSGNLLKEFVIDAQELLDAGQMYFELYDHIYSYNVEFFTYELFTSYSWYRGRYKLMSPIKDKIKFDIHKAHLKPKSEKFNYHLIFTPKGKRLVIKNNVESLKLIRYQHPIEFFIVDRNDPNILYEKFSIDDVDLQQKSILIKTKTDMHRKTVLYNNKYLGVLLNE